MARAALPEAVSLQVPPNLAPAREVLDCGIDDLGGVSPVTEDHVNPDYAWPALRELRSIAEDAGVPLRERLPVYERYLPAGLRSDGFAGEPADPTPVEATPDESVGAGLQAGARGHDGRWLSDRVRAAVTADDDAGRRYRAVLAGESLTSE
jgi:FO synthase subunit 1